MPKITDNIDWFGVVKSIVGVLGNAANKKHEAGKQVYEELLRAINRTYAVMYGKPISFTDDFKKDLRKKIYKHYSEWKKDPNVLVNKILIPFTLRAFKDVGISVDSIAALQVLTSNAKYKFVKGSKPFEVVIVPIEDNRAGLIYNNDDNDDLTFNWIEPKKTVKQMDEEIEAKKAIEKPKTNTNLVYYLLGGLVLFTLLID